MKKTTRKNRWIILLVAVLAAGLAGFVFTSHPGKTGSMEVPSATPLPEVVHTGLVEPLLTLYPGTAGSSLKRAAVAVKVLTFASQYAVADISADWEALTQEERTLFAENVISVSALLGETRADYDAYQGLYEDAGVLEQMNNLKDNETAWDNSASILKELEKLTAAG